MPTKYYIKIISYFSKWLSTLYSTAQSSRTYPPIEVESLLPAPTDVKKTNAPFTVYRNTFKLPIYNPRIKFPQSTWYATKVLVAQSFTEPPQSLAEPLQYEEKLSDVLESSTDVLAQTSLSLLPKESSQPPFEYASTDKESSRRSSSLWHIIINNLKKCFNNIKAFCVQLVGWLKPNTKLACHVNGVEPASDILATPYKACSQATCKEHALPYKVIAGGAVCNNKEISVWKVQDESVPTSWAMYANPCDGTIDPYEWYEADKIDRLLEILLPSRHLELRKFSANSVGTNLSDGSNLLGEQLEQFYQQLEEQSCNQAKRIVIPTNLYESHWVLLIIDEYPINDSQGEVSVVYFDPLGHSIHPDIKAALERVYPEGFSLNDLKKKGQYNNYDCGVWVVAAAESLVKTGTVPKTVNGVRLYHDQLLNRQSRTTLDKEATLNPTSPLSVSQPSSQTTKNSIGFFSNKTSLSPDQDLKTQPLIQCSGPVRVKRAG